MVGLSAIPRAPDAQPHQERKARHLARQASTDLSAFAARRAAFGALRIHG
jgi:hypothetical protein